MPSPLHSAAIEYAQRGWSVFPIQQPVLGDRESGKRPLVDASLGLFHGKDQATTDLALINAWWSKHPDANVGIALDKSGLVALDVDIGLDVKGVPKKGRESLAEFDNELPPTLTALTGSGGLHALYSAEGAPIHALKVREGIDIIGFGYIVAAPSRHYTGGEYHWHDVRAIAPVPPVLRRMAGEPRKTVEKVQLTGTPIGEGGRNIALFRLGAALRDQGIGAEALARALDAENKQRCNPPLPDAELALIVNSVLQRVQPSRDVAAGAIVEQEIKEIFVAQDKAVWVGDVAKQKAPPVRFYPTGFPELDEKIGGGIATRMVFGVIGPPSSGKSGFLGEILVNLQAQVPVLHVSDELGKEELLTRYAANKMEFPWIDGIKGRVARKHMLEAVQNLRVKLLDCDDLDRHDPIGHIRAEAIKLRDALGVAPVIAVDYVQLLARGSEDQTRHKVGELTMRLRQLSQELDTAVIAIFSTSRNFYGGAKLDAIRKGDDPTAYLAAAKESGDIEYDCATLIYLDIDKLREGQPKPGRLAIARCRVGEVGFVGIRARLDIGKWWADPSALAEMTVEERDGQKTAAQLEKDSERLLALVRKMPGRPWREVKSAAGMDFGRCDRAKAKLIELGICSFEKESFYDSMQREQKRDILKERNAPNGSPQE